MMRKTLFLLTLFVLIGSVFSSVHAQNTDAGLKPSVVTGEVVSASIDKIVLQTKDGSMDVVLSGKTEYKRVPPENPSLKAAVASSFTDIGVGDKLLVTGILSADKKSVFLEVPGLQPVMQMRIKMKINSADGARLPEEIVNTINAVGKE